MLEFLFEDCNRFEIGGRETLTFRRFALCIVP